MRAAEEPIRRISKLPPGKRIEIVCNNGDKIIGRLGPVTTDGLTLNRDKKGVGAPRQIDLTEIRSIRTKWTKGEKWLFGSVIYAGVVALVAVTLGG